MSTSSPSTVTARSMLASPNNLVRRVYQHREGLVPGFTKHYGIKQLVYYEQHGSAASAIQREKTMKHWPRDWKIRMIEKLNHAWRPLR